MRQKKVQQLLIFPQYGADSFDTLVQKGRDAWNNVLGKIEVEGGNLAELCIRTLFQFFDAFKKFLVTD